MWPFRTLLVLVIIFMGRKILHIGCMYSIYDTKFGPKKAINGDLHIRTHLYLYQNMCLCNIKFNRWKHFLGPIKVSQYIKER